MRSFSLAAFRGSDGRSLARALALLLLLNAFLGGFHAAMALEAETGIAVHCLAADGAGGGAPATPSRDHDCCLASCSAAPTGLPAATAAIRLPDPLFLDASAPAARDPAPFRLPPTHPAPRGPPLLA